MLCAVLCAVRCIIRCTVRVCARVLVLCAEIRLVHLVHLLLSHMLNEIKGNILLPLLPLLPLPRSSRFLRYREARHGRRSATRLRPGKARSITYNFMLP